MIVGSTGGVFSVFGTSAKLAGFLWAFRPEVSWEPQPDLSVSAVKHLLVFNM